MEGLVEELVVGIAALVIGLPLGVLALVVTLATRRRQETGCPHCRWPIGGRVAPARAQALMVLSSVAFVVGLLFGVVGLVVGIVLLVQGDDEWVNLVLLFGCTAPVCYLGARGLARYRTYPMRKCGNPRCGWTVPRVVPPSAPVSGLATSVPSPVVLALADERDLGGVVGSFPAARRYLFDRGLIVTRRSGSAAAYRWDEVTSVHYSPVGAYVHPVHRRTAFRYRLRTTAGTLRLTGSWRLIGVIGPHVAARVAEAMTPAAVAAVAEGGTLDFGFYRLSSTGLTTSIDDHTYRRTGVVDSPLPWSRVVRAEVVELDDAVNLVIWATRNEPGGTGEREAAVWHAFPASLIPNLDLLEILVARYAQGH